jgi:hypothetical protein
MLSQLVSWLTGRKRARAAPIAVHIGHGPVPRELLPEGIGRVIEISRDALPIHHRRNADLRGEAAETAPDDVPTSELMAICERYWNLLHQDSDLTSPEAWRKSVGVYNEYVRALNALGNRGPVVRDWARGLLTHPEYDARECGAWLLGELGSKGQLDPWVRSVIDELAVLIDRPIDEDTKERQAIDAAISALGKIGRPAAIPILRHVLDSNKMEHEDDTKWHATEALGELVGEPFMTAGDPPAAARAWLMEHRDRFRMLLRRPSWQPQSSTSRRSSVSRGHGAP